MRCCVTNQLSEKLKWELHDFLLSLQYSLDFPEISNTFKETAKEKLPLLIHSLMETETYEGKFRLTCGCSSRYGGFPCEWDSETRECEPAISFGSLCEKHYIEYEARPSIWIGKENG